MVQIRNKLQTTHCTLSRIWSHASIDVQGRTAFLYSALLMQHADSACDTGLVVMDVNHCWLLNWQGCMTCCFTCLPQTHYCFSYYVSAVKETATRLCGLCWPCIVRVHGCIARRRWHLTLSSSFITNYVSRSNISVTQILFRAFLQSIFIMYQSGPKTVSKSSTLLYRSSTGWIGMQRMYRNWTVLKSFTPCPEMVMYRSGPTADHTVFSNLTTDEVKFR